MHAFKLNELRLLFDFAPSLGKAAYVGSTSVVSSCAAKLQFYLWLRSVCLIIISASREPC